MSLRHPVSHILLSHKKENAPERARISERIPQYMKICMNTRIFLSMFGIAYAMDVSQDTTLTMAPLLVLHSWRCIYSSWMYMYKFVEVFMHI